MSLQQLRQDTDRKIETGISQFLTFMLNGEEFGVDILKIQCIQRWCKVTPIPNTPDFILGVIDLRGAAVVIVDLRERFELEDVSYGPATVVIVAQVRTHDTERTVGMVVDAVSDVCKVGVSEIIAAPDFGSTISVEYIKGLATVENKMVILLEIDKLINNGVLGLLPDQLLH